MRFISAFAIALISTAPAVQAQDQAQEISEANFQLLIDALSV